MFYAHMLGSITGVSVYVTEVLYFGYSQQSVMSKIWVSFNKRKASKTKTCNILWNAVWALSPPLPQWASRVHLVIFHMATKMMELKIFAIKGKCLSPKLCKHCSVTHWSTEMTYEANENNGIRPSSVCDMLSNQHPSHTCIQTF